MARVQISKDEWYPVYTMEEPCVESMGTEVPEDVYLRYQRVMKEFDDLQNILRGLDK